MSSPAGLKAALDGALRKSAAVWVRPDGHPSRLVWALWPSRPPHAGSLLVACGGTEQEVPGLVDGAAVTVVVARPGTRSAMAEIRCTAAAVDLDDATATALAAARRNASPGWTRVLALPLLGS